MMGKYQLIDNQVKAEQVTSGIADAPLKEGMTAG